MGTNKAKELDNYLQQVVVAKADEYYKQAMEHLINNKQQVVDEYVASFQKLCANIANKKLENPELKVSYIQSSLLLSHVLLKKPPYLMEAFDQDYYLGDVISQAEYNPEWIFDRLYAFYDEIQREAKKYILKVSPIVVERIFLIEVKKYEEIVKFLAKEAIETLVDTKEYQELPYGEEIQFRIGEFRGDTEILFIKNARNDEIWRYVSELFSNQTG